MGEHFEEFERGGDSREIEKSEVLELRMVHRLRIGHWKGSRMENID